jgi:hypothetical protein
MSRDGKVRVAIVGLGFGAEFIPIYQRHPNAEMSCVSPCLALMGKHAEHVVCHGSGRIDETLIPKYGSPFAIETATFKLRDSDVCAEVTRSLFNTARQYCESFDAYGSQHSSGNRWRTTRR